MGEQVAAALVSVVFAVAVKLAIPVVPEMGIEYRVGTPLLYPHT